MQQPIQQYYRMLLRLEYSISQYESLIKTDPVRFSRLQIPLRDSKIKYEKINLILNENPENPTTEEEKLQLKRFIINSEVRRIEGGLCIGCSYYLPNRLKGKLGYSGMIKKLETLPSDVAACIPANTRLSEPTRISCDMYAEDINPLRDDDLKELEDRIAAWTSLQAKYSSPQPAPIDKTAPSEKTK